MSMIVKVKDSIFNILIRILNFCTHVSILFWKMAQSMDIDSVNTSGYSRAHVSPLQFLVEVKNFICASHSTDYNLIFLNEDFKSLSIKKWDVENIIPPETLWKCFDRVDMLSKVKKYLKLIMELFIIRIETEKEHKEKLLEWHNVFIQLSDCISAFCSKEEYAKELIPVMKSFVELLLKKLRRVDMKDYHKEVFVHNFFRSILRQFFGCKILMNPILEEVITNSNDIVGLLSSQEGISLSEENVNNIECLNRYLDIVEMADRKRLRIIEKETLQNYKKLLVELMKIEVFPKYFSARVKTVLNMLKYE